MLKDLDLVEFQKLCLEKYGLKITKDQASEYWNSLISVLIWISSNSTDDDK